MTRLLDAGASQAEPLPGFRRIEVRHAGGLTELRLARPERRNAIDLLTAQELLAAALSERTAASRCVLLTGAGEHFCVGGDLKSFAGRPDLPEHLGTVTGYLHAAMSRLAALPAPLVVAAQGHVAGAGLGLACLGDVVITEEGSTFRSAYAALGLTPDAATSYLLPRLIGIRRAQRMTLLGHVAGAAEAVDWGLCTELVPAGTATAAARAVAERLAAGPTQAYGQTTRLLGEASRRSLAEHLEDESATLTRLARTTDAVEGIAAFIERRTPSFDGRPGA
ncbi:MAG TPA: enoyl-CoA hydratase-related protein [Jatrophihabitans sp.]|nr:enoyl-CoA hydratase-related protein [Jatrophihabitans sp.]